MLNKNRYRAGWAIAAIIAVTLVLQSSIVFGASQVDKILVLKSKRQLQLIKNGQVEKVYQVCLGRNPQGPKVHSGDGRTPEGTYIIDAKNAHSKYHLALHVSYPNSTDKSHSRSLGVATGGNIMIHGLPNRRGSKANSLLLRDWTAGCIAVSNYEIEEIWHIVSVGTPIEIRP